jgi:hypothetical protein
MPLIMPHAFDAVPAIIRGAGAVSDQAVGHLAATR